MGVYYFYINLLALIPLKNKKKAFGVLHIINVFEKSWRALIDKEMSKLIGNNKVLKVVLRKQQGNHRKV